jgi:hypothetical protein
MPDQMLAHVVLFTLKDRSEEAKRQLLADCKQYLSTQPGTVFFAAGTLAADIQWSISDRDFDVALLVVFQDKAAHEAYQDSPEHIEFLDKHSSAWSAIRVLDAYVE